MKDVTVQLQGCLRKMTLIPIGSGRNSQPPVKKENQNNNGNRHNCGSGQIGKLMGQKSFCKPCIIINDVSEPSACILAEIPNGSVTI